MRQWKWLGIMLLVLVLVSFGVYVWAGVGAEIERINKFRLSDNFYLSDFESSDTGEVKIHPTLIRICEELFQIQPFIITSGYRTPEWNKKIGGAPNSYHIRGLAVDLQPIFLEELTMKEALILFFEATSFYPEIGAIGLYRNHIHIDLRSEGSDSYYSGENKLYWIKLNNNPHYGYYYYRGTDAKERALAHFEEYY